jgi:hypothetical protein
VVTKTYKNLFEPFDGELKICISGKTIHLKRKIPIPICWIKISDQAGKIEFKMVERNLTETSIPLKVKSGFYDVTLVTEKSFATKMVFLE